MIEAEREWPTWLELVKAVAALPPDQAIAILSRATPRPDRPGAESGVTPPLPVFESWEDFLSRTTVGERQRWCAQKAKKANGKRLMSGTPENMITRVDVWTVLEVAKGRCAHCGSLAVEKRPSRSDGAPAKWEAVGRRVGSLGHLISRFAGGSNTLENLVWSCLWCNVWPTERILGATDRGGYYPRTKIGRSNPV